MPKVPKPPRTPRGRTKSPYLIPSPPHTADLGRNRHSTPSPSPELLLQIVLARMEDSKSFDWVGLAAKLGRNGGEKIRADGTSKKGKKGQKGQRESQPSYENSWSGSDLREIYHSTILPSLRSGKALWSEPPSCSTSKSASTSHARSTASPSLAAISPASTAQTEGPASPVQLAPRRIQNPKRPQRTAKIAAKGKMQAFIVLQEEEQKHAAEEGEEMQEEEEEEEAQETALSESSEEGSEESES